jgi:hypothetical protein
LGAVGFFIETDEIGAAAHVGMGRYPQVAVVVNEQTQSLLIVRVEESAFGTSMLCAINQMGHRSNFGRFSRTDRNSFISKVAEIASEMT